MTPVNWAHGTHTPTDKPRQFNNLLINTTAVPRAAGTHLWLWLSNTIQERQYIKQCCSRKSHRHVKGYIPRITASRHLIGKDSLVISFAVSINLGQKQKSFQSFQLKRLTGIKGSSCTPRARSLRFLSQQALVNSILLFSNLPEPCWLLEDDWGGSVWHASAFQPLKMGWRNAVLSASPSNSMSITSDCNTKPCWAAKAGNHASSHSRTKFSLFSKQPWLSSGKKQGREDGYMMAPWKLQMPLWAYSYRCRQEFNAFLLKPALQKAPPTQDTSHHCKLSYHLAAAPHVKNIRFPAGVQKTMHAQDLALQVHEV